MEVQPCIFLGIKVLPGPIERYKLENYTLDNTVDNLKIEAEKKTNLPSSSLGMNLLVQYFTKQPNFIIIYFKYWYWMNNWNLQNWYTMVKFWKRLPHSRTVEWRMGRWFMSWRSRICQYQLQRWGIQMRSCSSWMTLWGPWGAHPMHQGGRELCR